MENAMRPVRYVGIALGVLVALVVLALLSVKLFVNPNDFKPRIIAAVHESTGRDLSLPGELKLGVFPWVSVQFGPASLSNPAGFPATPFVAVRRVALRVRLLPLLRKQLQIGRIEVEGLDVRLLKNAGGKGNWEGLGGPKNAAAPSGSSASAESLKDLGGISVKDSRFSYQDLIADNVSLEVGRISSGVNTAVTAKLRVVTAPTAAPIELTTAFSFTPDFAASHIAVRDLNLTGTRAAAASSPALTVKFSAPAITTDLKQQTLSAPAFSAQVGEARLSGSLSGTSITDSPQFSGKFQLAQVSPRVLASTLGVTLPVTRDPQALTKLTASGDYRYGGNAVTADGLEVRLDDSTLRGRIAVTDLKTDALSFDLALDQIDFDRYRAPAAPAAAKPAASASTKAADSSDASLKSLILDGTIKVGSATVANLRASQFAATVAAKDAVTRIAPIRAQLYGGSYAGEITLDSRATVPAVKMEQTLNNVDMAGLLKDFAKSTRFSGHGNVTTSLTARGLGGDQFLATLNGRATAALNNGAIEGVDLWFEINRAMSLVQQQSLPGGSSSGRTKFDEFKVSADIVNGVATSKDLSIVSQNLRVAGAGTVNLASQALDYKVNATLLKQPTSGPVTSANTLALVPVNITGSLSSPKVSPDLQGIAKARLQQELDKHRGDLQQKLQDQLKNILK
jgi:AsmA protein